MPNNKTRAILECSKTNTRVIIYSQPRIAPNYEADSIGVRITNHARTRFNRKSSRLSTEVFRSSIHLCPCTKFHVIFILDPKRYVSSPHPSRTSSVAALSDAALRRGPSFDPPPCLPILDPYSRHTHDQTSGEGFEHEIDRQRDKRLKPRRKRVGRRMGWT
ncbi:hypothetical protein M427DRAFT_139559 [Gonapodya prolifera JEL478]|uniref:Uncharacterized protein n=1 Tax=Gonapodya prolifera (strain JEL478) TaxID=1344416 RepID=A0A139A0W3_GONPJ|nr:hypothetical protein M427DRAFT_139559 [Gonapodya prolifera JEL478]|eukprot:KXS10417.1 hypothetical protein M427DRAFT_139559 [Gonapodya prolifera JEL478]